MVDSGSRGCGRSFELRGIAGGSGESALDCLTVYAIHYTDISFRCCHGSVRRNKGIGEIQRQVWWSMKGLGHVANVLLVFTVSLVFSWVREQANEQSSSGGSYILISFLESLSSARIFSLYRLPLCDPYSPTLVKANDFPSGMIGISTSRLVGRVVGLRPRLPIDGRLATQKDADH